MATHACPPDGSGLTPCCERTPFELPATDRITSSPERVTCAGRERRKTAPCRTFVSGGTVDCCEEGETDCPCVCHEPGDAS